MYYTYKQIVVKTKNTSLLHTKEYWYGLLRYTVLRPGEAQRQFDVAFGRRVEASSMVDWCVGEHPVIQTLSDLLK